MHLLALLLALVANAAANVLIKAAAARTPEGAGALAQVLDLRFVVGLACFGLALVGYALALRRFDLSLGYPVMTGGGLVLVTLVSAWWFRETITPLRMIGILAILVGVVCVGASMGKRTSGGGATLTGDPTASP